VRGDGSRPIPIQVKLGGSSAPAAAQSRSAVREDVLSPVYDPALAFKVTLPSLVPAGNIGDTMSTGARQHGPLLDIDIPI
jgi:hypothetical protein